MKRPSQLIANKLRRNQTPAEARLWWAIRNRRLGGYKFRRQVPIGTRVADFACIEKLLIVELDGGQHSDRQHADDERTKEIKGHGYEVIRFWNFEVFENLDDVCDVILQKLEKRWDE